MDKKTPKMQRYDIRADKDGPFARKGKWLGSFVITHDGILFVFSDYGSYSYWWGSTGIDDFRSFLLDVDDGYLLDKISPGEEYDPTETAKSIKQAIIRRRREMSLNAADARTEWDLACSADFGSELGFADWGRDTNFADWYEYASRRKSPQAVAFTERVWPLFCAALRAEMSAESAQSS